MTAAELKKALGPIFIGDGFFGQWEPDEIVEPLARLSEEVQQEILSQVMVVWPVSQALTFVFLSSIEDALKCLHPHQIPEWVSSLLDSYEAGGLSGARRFVADVERNFVCRIRGESGLLFEKASRRLLPFARGLAGREIHLASADGVHTDTTTIHIPESVSLFSSDEENLLVYKLIVAWQWAYGDQGSFRPGRRAEHDILSTLPSPHAHDDSTFWLDAVIGSFGDRELALELFHLLETARLDTVLRHELPGLMRDTEPVRRHLLELRPAPSAGEERDGVLEAMRRWLLAGTSGVFLPERAGKCFDLAQAEMKVLAGMGRTVQDSVAALFRLYPQMEQLSGSTRGDPLLYQGRMDTSAIHEALRARRIESRKVFVETLAVILAAAGLDREERNAGNEPEYSAPPLTEESVTATAVLPGMETEPVKRNGKPERHDFIQLGENRFEVPDEMKALVRDIRKDLGEVPAEYISSAMDMAGRSGGYFEAPEEGRGEELPGESVYNEWDFRRQGFRKNWCRLLERNLDPVGGSFVGDTLQKYRGTIQQLKRQFELMRTHDRFLKRQRDGDEVDLDALVEALSDMRAGLEPSQRLFTRLVRDERSIAAVFLVDMSASTEGWISTALKESLVLLCEALESLGDRYAIYGFSGMRRTRSELYRIKSFGEPYNSTVKGRIAAVSARDYTRMGPPIRHLTRLLQDVEARVRLVITLSDGKPEDYDDYKGRYAVEDTRHALIEAKASGIHPFCITIDQNAQDYISHMYGEVNYIFIDQVRKLPLRIPEIYRTLTT